jgi:putative flippase GtrA
VTSMATRSTWDLRVQFSRFAVVGLWNTLLDYGLFIGLTKIFSIPLDWVWTAKAVSGTVAILNSYLLNRTWVFHGQGRIVREGSTFIAAAVFGVYAIQTPLTHLFSSVFPELGMRMFDLVSALGISDVFPNIVTEAFMIKTTAFAIASVATMTWNFLAYRYLVFGASRNRNQATE